MKKLLFLVFACNLITINTLFAEATAPTIPAGCFDNDTYCTESYVYRNAQNIKIIYVSVFAKLSGWSYSSAEEIKNIYFAFAKWPEYARASGIDYVRFTESRELEPIVYNGVTVRRHKAIYDSWSPIFWMSVKELAYYQDIEKPEGFAYSMRFDPAPPEHFAYEGVKKSGELYIKYDQENNEYLLYFISHTIPAVNVLPELGLSFVETGILSIFKGMFSL